MSKYERFMDLVHELEFETNRGGSAFVMADGNLNPDDLGHLDKSEAIELAKWILSVYTDPHDPGVSDK